MLAWVNKRKRLLQTTVILLGFCFLGVLLYLAYTNKGVPPRPFAASGRAGVPHGPRGGLSAADRGWRQLANGYALAAVTGVCALVALYFLRLSFKYEHPWKSLSRWVFRLLQVIHIPLAVVMLVAALGHGYYYLFYRWSPNLNSYTGIVALAGAAVASVLGLVLTQWRKSRKVHLATAICAFALVLIHILT